jgi:hypothetical protein
VLDWSIACRIPNWIQFTSGTDKQNRKLFLDIIQEANLYRKHVSLYRFISLVHENIFCPADIVIIIDFLLTSLAVSNTTTDKPSHTCYKDSLSHVYQFTWTHVYQCTTFRVVKVCLIFLSLIFVVIVSVPRVNLERSRMNSRYSSRLQ